MIWIHAYLPKNGLGIIAIKSHVSHSDQYFQIWFQACWRGSLTGPRPSPLLRGVPPVSVLQLQLTQPLNVPLQSESVYFKSEKIYRWFFLCPVTRFPGLADIRCETESLDGNKEYFLFSAHRHFKLLAGFGNFNGQMSDHHHAGDARQDHVPILFGQHNHRDAGKKQNKPVRWCVWVPPCTCGICPKRRSKPAWFAVHDDRGT